MKTTKLQLLLIVAGLMNFNSHAQSTATNCTPPPSGIVSWWPAEGNAYDQIGNNNGIIIGHAAYTNGEVGQGFAFNGNGQGVSVTGGTNLWLQNFTIESWVERASASAVSYGSGGNGTIFGYGPGGYFFGMDSAGTLFFAQLGNNALTAGAVITDTNFHHVAVTKTGSTVIFYIDGTAYPAPAYNPTFTFSGGAGIGYRPDNGDNSFYGVIDELSIYNRALSQSEIQGIYNAGSEGKCNFHPYVPPPRTATGTATLAGAFVVGVTITDGGAGYTNTPSIRLIGGGGSGAQAVAVVSNGVVVIVNVINAGSGYTNVPVVVFDPPFIPNPVLGIASASILTFSNLMVGSSYQLQQFQSTIWVNQGGTLTASNIIYSQVVSGIPDSASYRLALTPIPQQATAVSQVFNGFVVGVQITARGSGYVTSPTVTFAGNGNVGSNAMAVASIYNGAVTNITVINAGIGYVAPVTVQIDPPPVTALSPKVTPGALINSSSLAPYENYQIQFRTDFGSTWGNLSGGMFTPTAATNAQYVFLTNYTAFFRLQYLP